MIVNLKCRKCGKIYNFDVGDPSIDNRYKLVFANKPICPKCKVKDKELLTELGQSQMTSWHLGGL